MTKSVADKSPTSVTLRGHTDPPGMWVAILLCSAMLHASAFLIMRSLDFGSFKPKRSVSSIPIEIVRVPKKQTRTQPRVIAQQQPKAPIKLQSKPVTTKPQATTPQVPSAIQPQLVKPIIPETQQRDAIAFGNPSITRNTPTPTPKTQPFTKPKVEQKTLPKPQLENQAEQQRQQKLALQRQQQAQRQRDIAEQRQRDIAEQRQRDIAERQRDIAEQRQRDIAEQRQRDIAKNQSEVPTSSDSVAVDKNPPPPPDGTVATNETTGGFLTASFSVLPNQEQQTNLNLIADVKFIPKIKQKTLTPNKLPLLDEKDRQLITQPITCPVILSIDANGKIFKDKGILIPDDAPQKDICKRYAEEYFKQNRGNIEFEPGRDSANKPVSSGLWIEIEIQPLAVDKKIPN